MTRGRVGNVLIHVFLAVSALVVLLPFVWVFFGAFKTTAEILRNPSAVFPESFTMENFVTLFTERHFGVFLRNSLIVTTTIMLTNLVFGSMAGYALDKLSFRLKRLVMGSVLVMLMIPYIAIFVPQFIIIVKLGLVDTIPGLFLPNVVLPISVFIVRQASIAVPDELIVAARVEGASEFRIFTSIFLPLIRPSMATVAILTFLTSWNYFLWPLVVAQSQDMYTLPVGLAIVTQAADVLDFGLLLSGALLLLLPVLVVFLVLQKYFVQGIATTGLK